MSAADKDPLQTAFYTAEFNKFAKNGMINDLTTFAKLMRALGQNMTPADLSKMHGGSMSLQKFLDLMTQTLVKDDTNAEVIEAFKVFDRDGKGLLAITDLRFVLTNQGDKLDPEQSESIVGRISTTDGQFNYYNLVDQFSSMRQ